MCAEKIQTLEQSLIESKKLSIDQQTKVMQLTIQLESTEGQLQAQVCLYVFKQNKKKLKFLWISLLIKKRSLDMGIDEKNEAILNLDRQLREKTQRIEQVKEYF